MRSGFHSRLMLFFATALCAVPIAHPQSSTSQFAPEYEATGSSVCGEATMNSAASQALRLVCQRAPVAHTLSSSKSTEIIVVGFVGGFTKPDDLQRPEVLFASYLREHYGSQIHARVFSNRDAKGALSYVLRFLDTNQGRIASSDEKRNARVIIYGHSWGASETAEFAKELGRHRVPVRLTVQLDIISKPGQKPAIIPPNVANAINFYQPGGPLHGRPAIVASDPANTTILGNVRMAYDHSTVNCDNYNWFVRTFNKPHHEIENDANVWDQVASLIDSEIWLEDRRDRSGGSLSTNGQEDFQP